MNQELILQALRGVPDPRTGQSIVLSSMISNVTVNGDSVNIEVLLPSLNFPQKGELNAAIMQAVMKAFPSADVNVHFKASATTETDTSRPLPQVKNIIAVGSGKGGVGKSTVAVNLALGLREMGAKVGLLDADVYGPSVPTMLGVANKRPLVKDVLGMPRLVPVEAYGISTMSIGYIIEPEAAVVLRGPRLGGIIRQFINDCLWDELDYLIIDLPPGTGDVQLSLIQTVPITGAVIVSTPQDVAVIDAVKAINMFLLENVNIPILGIVENMAWFTPAELPENKYYIFGEGGGKKLAKMAETMLLGQIPLVQGIREAGDAGKPAVLRDDVPQVQEAFMKIVKNLMRQVAVRNEMFAPSQVVQMK